MNHQNEVATDSLAHSIQELHRRTGLSKEFLRKEAREGRLKVRRFGKRVMVLANDWRNYVESLPTTIGK